MTAHVIDGKAVAARIRDEIAAETDRFQQQTSITPHLSAVLVGDDPASAVYVRNKQRACEKTGIKSSLHRLGAETTQDELLGRVEQLNADESVHGILVQLPLPGHLDQTPVLDAVSPLKDVDAFHPENVGRIVQGDALDFCRALRMESSSCWSIPGCRSKGPTWSYSAAARLSASRWR